MARLGCVVGLPYLLRGGEMPGTGYTDSELPIEMEQPEDTGLNCAHPGRMVTSVGSSTEDGERASSEDGG